MRRQVGMVTDTCHGNRAPPDSGEGGPLNGTCGQSGPPSTILRPGPGTIPNIPFLQTCLNPNPQQIRPVITPDLSRRLGVGPQAAHPPSPPSTLGLSGLWQPQGLGTEPAALSSSSGPSPLSSSFSSVLYDIFFFLEAAPEPAQSPSSASWPTACQPLGL